MFTNLRPFRIALAAGAGLLLTTAACGSGEGPASTAVAATSSAGSIVLQDPWVKTADSGMTAVFGTLRNTGSSTVSVVSATTSASPRTELHETVMDGGAMQMRRKDGGFEITAGGAHELAPGGDHIMVMDLTTPVAAGDQVEVTLKLSDGSTTTVEALGKATTAGEEKYEDMDMSSTASATAGQ